LPFISLLIIFTVCYGLAYLFGRRFRHLIPKGKEFNIGSACSMGILIIFMTRNFWFPSDKNDLYFAIGFGLSTGLISSITSFGRKIK